MDPHEAETRIRRWWGKTCEEAEASARRTHADNIPLMVASKKTLISAAAAGLTGYIQAVVDLGYLPEERISFLIIDLLATAEGRPIEIRGEP
jgi:hypothetical protein